jgi:CHAT domain-containing protein
MARELYRTLLAPVEAEIARSVRVLISPDGPLHGVPFAALTSGDPERYLVERRPIHIVASATVYAELKKSRRLAAPYEGRLVAFGDPKYPRLSKDADDDLGNSELRSALLRGNDFPRLPKSRVEVENIAALFPSQTTAFLGEQAREERVKGLGKDVRYVHFACHGVLNELFPLDSALALSLPKALKPGEDNGLLQAWEIFDSVRLDADLVTLSACQSGLGKEMGGEGLLGLTRAFQYAGARSVLASLWSVDDDSTAELMKRFYRRLRDGASKDEALRGAQMEMMKIQPHPFHWAAFQLSGDWK